MNSSHLRKIILAAAVFSGAAACHATTIDLLGSGSTWYGHTSGGSKGVSGGSLTYSPTSEGGEILSHFDPVSLAVGETATLSFTYSIAMESGTNPNNRSHSLRIGLFNSNDGALVTSNGFASANAQDYTGYFLSANPRHSNADQAHLRFRGGVGPDSTNGFLLGGGASDVPGSVLVSDGNHRVYTTDPDTIGFLSITRTDLNGVSIEYSLGGASVSWTGAADQFTFDTIGVFYGRVDGSTATTLTISSLTLDVTPVPEPAGAAVLAGAAALVLIGARRRRA